MTGQHRRPADPLPSNRRIIVAGLAGLALALAGGVPLVACESSRPPAVQVPLAVVCDGPGDGPARCPTPPASPLGDVIGQALAVGGDGRE